MNFRDLGDTSPTPDGGPPPGRGAAPAGAAGESAQGAPGSSARNDSLTRALQWLLRHYGIERTALSLFDGLPFEQRVTPLLAQRAMTEAGFAARLVKRKPKALYSALMPAVLMLTEGRACVLLRRIDGDGAGSGMGTASAAPSAPFATGRRSKAEASYEIVGPDQEIATVISEAELAAIYTGHCLLLKRKPTVDSRGAGLHSPGSHNSAHGWLWNTLWGYRRYYRDAVIASVLINVLTVAVGLFAMNVYDRVIPHKAYASLWSLAIGAVAAMLFEATARHLRTYLLDLAGKKADVVLASALFRHTLGVRLEHMPDSAGTMAHQLHEFETVREFGTSATLAVLTDLPFVLLFVFMVFMVGGEMGWVPLLSIPLVMGAAAAIQFPLRKLMSANMRESAQLNGVMIESLEGMETLRASGASGFMQKRYEDSTASTAMSGMRSRAMSNWVSNFVQFAQQAETVVMLVWGTYLIHEGQLSTGGLVGAVMFANRAIAPLSQFTSLAARYQGARAALNALNQLMQMPTERDPNRQYVSRPRLAGAIALHQASFSYPSQRQHGARPALQNVNITIRPGERVAIIGRIGSGKSTALRLMGGLYQPVEGQVHLDGIDLRQIDPGDLRSHIGLVGQDVRLFHGTLRENVMLGRPNASWDAYLSAARLTGLDRIAAAHPLGHDLPIGELGAGLSGGQRQLVALARALVTRPRILLLDEPTSAMDLQTENAFIHHLQGIVQQRTVVIVTHRPSLLPLVDRLIVIDDGRVVADGPKAKVLDMLAGQPAGAGGPAAAAAAGGAPAPSAGAAPQATAA